MAAGSLGRQAIRYAAIMASAQAWRVLSTIASTVVLARLLSPDQFGVVAMSAPIIAFMLLFQNLGLDQAVIQAKDLDRDVLSTLFWISVATALALAAILVAIGPLVALFYADARAGQYVMASSLIVMAMAPALIHTALLNREMRFAALAIVDIANSLTQLVVTIVAGVLLHSFWALWLGSAAGALVALVIVWTIEPWRPSMRLDFRKARSQIAFGRNVTGFNIVNFFARNADNILIAKVWGGTDVGFYDRAYKLMMFPLQNINAPLARVVLPILARVKDQPDRFRRVYLMIVRTLMLVILPGVTVVGATSYQIIPVLLGEQWLPVAPIFSWLGLAALLQPFFNASGWLFMSWNRTDAMFQWGLFASVVLVISFIAGLPGGGIGVARAYFFSHVVFVPIFLVWAPRIVPISGSDFAKLLFPPLCVSAISWLVISNYFLFLSLGPMLCAALAVSYGLAIASLPVTADGRDLCHRGLRFLRSRLRRHERPSAT